ncbi:alpha/beta fold hydrolase [Streptomyces sp. IB2014 016-6]|uniref:alpha/beta hydrolase n=1 Tax=Streptomyces sp. IB2014 016-6 TaxID=2517818 RepID=UPI0011CBFEDB|nr:alpha/beta fold hydrolase [Streptomyces sp. IB2014 016-6]TXL91405.1 alpha/beta fold hydrolase [Streptomyces sp. IB2014 016-6]
MDLAVTAVRTALNAASHISPGLAGRAAFRLFRKPRGRSRLRPDERPVMDRAEVGEIAVGGGRAVSYRWGTGERPVLIVHGWESRGSRFATLVSELLDLGLSPIAFDAPGHGEATGETMTILDLRDIIAALDAEHGPFETVVAHSLGVTATFVAVQERGVRTERIVAISGVPDFAYLVDGFCAGLGLRARLNRELRGRIERELFTGEGDTWSRFSVPRTDTGAGTGAGIRTPEAAGASSFLVVHDEDDDLVDPAASRALHAALNATPGREARLLVTRGLGHRRIIGDRQVAASVRDFVVSGTPARAAAAPDPSPRTAAG